MAHLTIRRRKSKPQRAADAAITFLKARIAWIAGRKATKLAVPAAAAGTAAVVARKRFAHNHPEPPAPSTTGVDTVPQAPAGVA